VLYDGRSGEMMLYRDNRSVMEKEILYGYEEPERERREICLDMYFDYENDGSYDVIVYCRGISYPEFHFSFLWLKEPVKIHDFKAR
jgi:hypothetical protein